MKVAIVEVIDMVGVFDGDMPAGRTMHVTVIGMSVESAHKIPGLASRKHCRSEENCNTRFDLL
jgi:hypothetical protein